MSSSPKQRSTSWKRSPPSSSSDSGSANNDNNYTSSTKKKARLHEDDQFSLNSPRRLTYGNSSSSAQRSGRLSNGDTASASSFPGNGNGNDSSYYYSSPGHVGDGRQGYKNREQYGYENNENNNNTNNNNYGPQFRNPYDPRRSLSYNPSHGSGGTYLHHPHAHIHGHHDHHMYGPSPSSYPDHCSIYSHGDRVLPLSRENSNNNSHDVTYARNGHFLSRPRGNKNENAFGSSFNPYDESHSQLDSYAQGLGPSARPIHGSSYRPIHGSSYNHGGQFAPHPIDTIVYSHGEVRSQLSSPNKPMAEFPICSPTPQKNSRSSVVVLPECDQPEGWLLGNELPKLGNCYDIHHYKSTFREKLKLHRHQSQFYEGVLDVNQRQALLKYTDDHLPFDMLSLEQKKRLVRDEKKRAQDRNNQKEKRQAASNHNFVLKVLDGGIKERKTVSKQGHDERKLVLESVASTFRNNLDGVVDDGLDDLEIESTIELEVEDERPEYKLKEYMCCSDHCPRSLAQEGLSNGHHLFKKAFSGVKNFEGIESSSGFSAAVNIVKKNVPQMLRPELKTLQDCLWQPSHGVATVRNRSGHEPNFVDLPSQEKFVDNINKFSEALVAIVNAIPGSKVRATYDNTENVRCVCPPLAKAEDENDRLRKELQQKDKELEQKDQELQQKDQEQVQQSAETEKMKQKYRRLVQTLFTDMGQGKAREVLKKADKLQKDQNDVS